MSRPQFEALECRRLFAGGTILFVRGAERSGGFLEATSDAQRTEQLADLDNASQRAGNHGWAGLRTLLIEKGYDVQQAVEPLERDATSAGQTAGASLDLAGMNLSQFTAVVMASNNAAYRQSQIDAVDAYIQEGGGVLFISDGNFGSSWADAPASDNAFLSRYGMAFNQDNGTYAVSRDGGNFVRRDEPVLRGVNAFDGEGVSPIRLTSVVPDGVTVRQVVRVPAGGTTYDNNPTGTANNGRGRTRTTTTRDSALVLANAGAGRVAAFFDRNTFFNKNGAGTDLSRNDNTRLATNLFAWVSDHDSPAVTASDFTQGSPATLTFRLDDNLNGTLAREDIRLRHRRTGAAIAGRDWTLSLTDGDGFTDVTIRIPSAAAGPYQLQVPRGALADDSGNVRRGAIRYGFTIIAGPARGVASFVRPTPAFAGPTPTDLADDVLERAAVVG